MWVEQQEECHTVQVKVHHHHEHPKHKKWKRSSEEGDVENEEEAEKGLDELPEGVVEVEGENMAVEGGARKERSLGPLGLGLGAVVGVESLHKKTFFVFSSGADCFRWRNTLLNKCLKRRFAQMSLLPLVLDPPEIQKYRNTVKFKVVAGY